MTQHRQRCLTHKGVGAVRGCLIQPVLSRFPKGHHSISRRTLKIKSLTFRGRSLPFLFYVFVFHFCLLEQFIRRRRFCLCVWTGKCEKQAESYSTSLLEIVSFLTNAVPTSHFPSWKTSCSGSFFKGKHFMFREIEHG